MLPRWSKINTTYFLWIHNFGCFNLGTSLSKQQLERWLLQIGGWTGTRAKRVGRLALFVLTNAGRHVKSAEDLGWFCNFAKSSIYLLLRSAMAGRLYKLQSKHTSNSGFNQTFIPCSGYIFFAAEQRVGYQISWVDLQREVNCPWNL